jgi:UDP-N-acetylmuramyl pentapeptide synthase
MARLLVGKYQPVIVGITGSTGKTTTRKAIVAALSKRFRVSTPPRNLNDKLGLPLAIIGEDTAGKNPWGWFMVIVRAMIKYTSNVRYPEVLVLEYGIDRVGEMDQLLAVAKPKIGVLTGIGLSHYEFFQDPKTIEQEKGKLLAAVPENGLSVVNAKSPGALNVISQSKAPVITYGSSEADVGLVSVQEDFVSRLSLVEIQGKKDVYKISLSALGAPHTVGLSAAVAVAEHMGMEKKDLEEGLATYTPVPGRLNIIQGLKKSWIIDDTYNAAPDSMLEALNLFSRFPAQHKIAVLGDMLELGALSLEEHKKIGEVVAQIAPKHLVTVGAAGKIIAEQAIAKGLPEERVVAMDTSAEAMHVVHDLVEEGSLVLVKGSQGVRLEKVVKEIMAEPMKARDLLCRQDDTWLRR